MRKCFDRHNCDKGYYHGYERVYEPAFENLREEPLHILEVGIFKGAGIAVWLNYFPNATIVGIDTFQRVKPYEIPILKHPRVEWHEHDSTTPLDIGRFDFVIDDGCHTHIAQRKTFENFMPYVDGAYFIEDVWALDHMTAAEKRHPWLKKDGYSDREYQELLNTLEPYTVKFHDLRAGHQPDSFIIEVTNEHT